MSKYTFRGICEEDRDIIIIDGAVEKARHVEEWRSTYIYYDINLMDARDEGRDALLNLIIIVL